MINRRQFIESGSLLTLGSMLSAAKAAEARSPSTAPAHAAAKLGCAVVDGRCVASRAFALELQRAGLTVHLTAGNVTQVWYEHLQPRWRVAPIAVAGFTTFSALFCLERLGWDHRLRLVYRGLHTGAAHGRLEHRIVAAARLRERLRLELLADAWPERLARTLAAAPESADWHREPAVTSSSQESTLATRAASMPQGLPLYSWVIA